ncbi:cupin domain-containing protein [Flagellimonas meridianipacifica]|uniref:Cupin domain-containing protein n=1 Tax=Flagellimonas meridianipacifica TaxID=1080225 RepID=A0A2T0MIY4_9FLAO|nr:cupin domain-containing protein [Allomuricauda pacifica]PRX57515.1 Cupin domain-containing protein [Allomuricauda pacifica]
MKSRKKTRINTGKNIATFVMAFCSVLSISLYGQKDTKNDPTHARHSKNFDRVMHADYGKHLWIFPKNKDTLGSGGKLQIFMDHESHPHASASFAKYELGVGGALPEHKHDRTEEIAYFLSGEGIVITYVNGKRTETIVKNGYVWYTPPGEYHSFINTGNEPLQLVFAVIPNEKTGLLSFFEKIGANPGQDARTFSPEEFAQIANEHDLVLKPTKKIE